MLFAIVALLVFGAMLLGARDETDTATTGMPATSVGSGLAGPSPSPTEADCVRIRREWHEFSLVDFDLSQQIKTQYQAAGCESLCGGLVEDTDTPEAETRCEYP